jgi:hypothetical protein
MSKSHVVVITFRNAQGRTECYIRISLEKAESQGRLVVDSLGRKRRLNSGIAHGLPTACSQTAHGPLMGVKRAMIGGTRKNADLKQPSRVSFVDWNVLRCLHLRSPGPRANASGNGTGSPYSCTVFIRGRPTLPYGHRPKKRSLGTPYGKAAKVAYATTSSLHGSGRITSLRLYFWALAMLAYNAWDSQMNFLVLSIITQLRLVHQNRWQLAWGTQ